MVGSTIWRVLEKNGYTNVVGRTSSELVLINQANVEAFLADEKVEFAIDAAVRVGGILANNNFPYQFILNSRFQDLNLKQSNRIERL